MSESEKNPYPSDSPEGLLWENWQGALRAARAY